jgi:anti-sigma regulatory factor (Ser/Thr protein kinase)
MGLFIIRACMDTVTYERGNPPSLPNVLTLTKCFSSPSLEAAEGQ